MDAAPRSVTRSRRGVRTTYRRRPRGPSHHMGALRAVWAHGAARLSSTESGLRCRAHHHRAAPPARVRAAASGGRRFGSRSRCRCESSRRRPRVSRTQSLHKQPEWCFASLLLRRRIGYCLQQRQPQQGRPKGIVLVGTSTDRTISCRILEQATQTPKVPN
jgi:hypothetical protein